MDVSADYIHLLIVFTDYLHLYMQSTCIIKEDLLALCSADVCSNDPLNHLHMCPDIKNDVFNQSKVSDIFYVLVFYPYFLKRE